jgi:hypothetical protein
MVGVALGQRKLSAPNYDLAKGITTQAGMQEVLTVQLVG